MVFLPPLRLNLKGNDSEMISSLKVPHKKRDCTPQPLTNLIVLHPIDNSRNEGGLCIWMLAITVQALLCIWMVIQASAPACGGMEGAGNAICDFTGAVDLKTVTSNPVTDGVSELRRP